MGSDTTSVPAPMPLGRLAGVGLIVFLANAALLVLQLVAGRLLAPFIGSSLETWTSVIGVFLTGIALGNALGGRIADRYPTPRTLAILLAVGALAALWMVAFPLLLANTGAHKVFGLGWRIPVLCLVLCLPAGLVLSLLTPLAIKLGLPDVSKTGRVAGMVFALSTLGCLLGNYVTGFYLIPAFTINTLVFVSAGSLAALAGLTLVVIRDVPGEVAAPAGQQFNGGSSQSPSANDPQTPANPYALTDIRQAYFVVFLASFGGMTLELTASRVLAQTLGVSLFTWTGIIGVMLAGTALGNLTGGLLADRLNRPGGRIDPRTALAATLMFAAASTVFMFVSLALVTRAGVFDNIDPILQVIGWTFSLFFLPMFLLGMVSPQVIRLSMADVAHAGRVAGRVYAWSTAGAIAGTFAAGYVLLSTLGMYKTLLGVSLLLLWLGGWIVSRVYAVWGGLAALGIAALAVTYTTRSDGLDLPAPWAGRAALGLVAAAALVMVGAAWAAERVFRAVGAAERLRRAGVRPIPSPGGNAQPDGLVLYLYSIVLGGITGGLILTHRSANREFDHIAQLETNYYTIRVTWELVPRFDHFGRVIQDRDGSLEYVRRGRKLNLDHLLHSIARPDDPTFLHYEHEHVQMEFLRAARAESTEPRVLVIGGGGYTFPRCAKELVPETVMDVVEIDPGVTAMAFAHLGLKRYPGMTPYHMDGRQFVDEKAAPGSYDLIIQDAVNDFSVPAHLLTKEYNDAVKKALKPNGVYLLTIIDAVNFGKLWKAAMLTLGETYPPENVALLSHGKFDLRGRQVYVIYASDRPFDREALQAVVAPRIRSEVAPGVAAAVAVGGMSAGAEGFGGVAHGIAAAAAAEPLATVMEPPLRTYRVPPESLQKYLDKPPRIILTDQYSPVDNLMAEVFRYRFQERKADPEEEPEK